MSDVLQSFKGLKIYEVTPKEDPNLHLIVACATWDQAIKKARTLMKEKSYEEIGAVELYGVVDA